jgi:hypothetical protein
MPYERALALADGPEEALRESLGVLEQLGLLVSAVARPFLLELMRSKSYKCNSRRLVSCCSPVQDTNSSNVTTRNRCPIIA